MLTHLSQDQKNLSEAICQKYLTNAVSSGGKIDVSAFSEGINWIYGSLLKEPVPQIVFCDSLLSCLLSIHELKKIDRGLLGREQGGYMGKLIWDRIRNRLEAKVRLNVEPNLRASLFESEGLHIAERISHGLLAAIKNDAYRCLNPITLQSFGSDLTSSVEKSMVNLVSCKKIRSVPFSNMDCQKVREIITEYVPEMGYDAYRWVAYYDFLTQCGVIKYDRFDSYLRFTQSGVFMLYGYKKVIFAVSPPKVLATNEDGRLHCTSGPALSFNDNTQRYFINGRNIPSRIVEQPHMITRENFLKEKNTDIKGAIYEVLGQKGMFKLLGAEEVDSRTIVHVNGDLEQVKLYKTRDVFPEIGNQPFAWVRMICPSTGTNYLQGVEPHHSSALEAIASLSIFSPEEYSFTDRA